jgi:hypothetical protein
MINEVKNIPILLKQYGLARLIYRSYFEIIKKTALLRARFPNSDWHDNVTVKNIINNAKGNDLSFKAYLEQKRTNFLPTAEVTLRSNLLKFRDRSDEIDELMQGNFLYFSRNFGNLGFPNPRWLYNPFNSKKFSMKEHWIDISEFNLDLGDIKYIWEPSRFGWVYPIVREYAATGNEELPEMFWNLVESWMETNPPNKGPNWQCGQETAIRIFSLIFALFAFLNSKSTTEPRLRKAFSLLYTSALRILRHINYARIQMGNHAASEAGALFTLGVLFPFLKDSGKLKKVGMYVLEDEIKRFNFPDGSYIQHSMNYQRLMLHVYLWCFRLADLNSIRFSDLSYKRIQNSYLFLYNMQDADTGYTPNYGPNDGANIFPLSNCEYPDFRPVIQAFHYFYTKKRIYKAGPYDEILLWLFGPESLRSEIDIVERKSKGFSDGGYFTLRRKDSWGMVRCHTYRSRPNQADMLHFDLWWKGTNILRDSGTYSYFDPEQNWNKFFVSTRAHNTIEVGGTDQMIKGSRFRWYSLLDSKFHFHETGNQFEVWQGEHNGYKRLPSKAIHRRAIVNLFDNVWIVVDDIIGKGKELTRLIWNFPDIPYLEIKNGIKLSTVNGDVELVVVSSIKNLSIKTKFGEESGDRFGFSSLYYGEKIPTPVLIAESQSELPVRYVTIITLGGKIPGFEYNNTSVQLQKKELNERANVVLGEMGISGSCIEEVLIEDNSVWKRIKSNSDAN